MKIIERLGHTIGWLFTAVAALLTFLAVMGLVAPGALPTGGVGWRSDQIVGATPAAPVMNPPDIGFAVIVMAAALLIYAIGRAVRYMLVGDFKFL